MTLTEAEIDDMKKELILLRMHNKRLQEDLKKMQEMIKDIMILKLSESLPEEEKSKDEQTELTEDTAGNCA